MSHKCVQYCIRSYKAAWYYKVANNSTNSGRKEHLESFGLLKLQETLKIHERIYNPRKFIDGDAI